MIIDEVVITLIVGVILSLLFTEVTGILPAGLIVPGYLALAIVQPKSIVMVLMVAILTNIIVVNIISKMTILYGKRKYVAMITIGILLQYSIVYLLPEMNVAIYGLSAVGLIIPGLIANTIQRQGLIPTISSTSILTVLTFAISIGIGYL